MSRPHLSNLEEMWSEVLIILSSQGEQGETHSNCSDVSFLNKFVNPLFKWTVFLTIRATEVVVTWRNDVTDGHLVNLFFNWLKRFESLKWIEMRWLERVVSRDYLVLRGRAALTEFKLRRWEKRQFIHCQIPSTRASETCSSLNRGVEDTKCGRCIKWTILDKRGLFTLSCFWI